MKRLLGVTVIAGALAISACGVESTPLVVPPELPDPGVTSEAMIGAAGGTVELGSATLEIPADALAQDTQIRIVVEDAAVPSAFHAYSPVFRFEPAGQAFAQPVTVTLPYDGDAATATIFWTAAGSTNYMALPTTVSNGLATAQVTHFSEAFVGTGCAGDDCCDRSNGQLDILLVVDNSNSMSQEQESLAEQLPRMAEVLATGDLDEDGAQDFPALQSVRVGVVTTDMGTGGYTIQTCSNPLVGDNGVLQDTPNGDAVGCDASYPSFAELSADADPASIEGFVEHVRCVGVLGTGGCGFEQQLEASLSAVTVQAAEGMPNAGFLRDESLLAVVVMTDEDDCSTGNAEIFNPQRDDLGSLNVRCALNPGELYPAERYAVGLEALRSDPQDVIFALVAGVPVDLVADPGAVDLDAVLADPRMSTLIDPENPNELVHSCDTDIGVAYPPQRLVQTAAAFGSNAVVQSICQEDFTPVIGAILSRVASRARGECL